MHERDEEYAEKRGPTVAHFAHMMAAQAVFWGLAIALFATELLGLFAMIVGPFVSAYSIWSFVRFLNWRDDPRSVNPPPDAP